MATMDSTPWVFMVSIIIPRAVPPLKGFITATGKASTKSAEILQKIIADYADGIRADNALYELALLNENQLGNPEKAKELYEKIFIEYSGSTFAVEARKRFRILRGDDI